MIGLAAETALTMLQHADSTFPSGGFAFSAGIEGLVADGKVGQDDLAALVSGWLRWRWAPFEQVFVCRAASFLGDVDALACVDAELEAMLWAPAERHGSACAGAALLASHLRMGTPGATELDVAVKGKLLIGHRVVLEGALWANTGLGRTEIRLVSAYTYVSTLSSAAVRLGICSAIAQQRLLADLVPTMARLASEPLGTTRNRGLLARSPRSR
ncbi:MAG: urease accessory protein UreF [Nocardioidaceae bacterium]|nr:MAG: urease accessory protein UreF [Nocardioidaceae bacterium]